MNTDDDRYEKETKKITEGTIVLVILTLILSFAITLLIFNEPIAILLTR